MEMQNMVTEEEVIQKLKTIIDPHTGTSLYEMELISDIDIKDEEVALSFEPSSPYCPLGIQLAQAIKNGIEEVDGVSKVKVNVKGHVKADEINEELCRT
jgi:metal-sulfur cluster biosynthetic enzyme